MKVKNKSLAFMSWAWPIELIAYIVITVMFCFINGTHFSDWIQALPILGGLTGVQGAICFGGPALKDFASKEK
jgi:hypothetical protein